MIFKTAKVVGKISSVILAALAALSLLGAAFMAKPELFDGRYRRLMQFYGRIGPGMSYADVLKLRSEIFPANGVWHRPSENGSPDFNPPDCDVCFNLAPEGEQRGVWTTIGLRFSYGHVVSKSYHGEW
jgi:hypothetical protein